MQTIFRVKFMIDSFYTTQFTPEKNSLTGKNIVVTGAGDGIGRIAALTFANLGATVILVGRTLSKLESVYDEIENNNNPKPAIFPLHLEHASEHDYIIMQATLEKEFGKLDGLLHNAGELGTRTPVADYAITEWQKVMHVNVTAPFLMTKALFPLMKKADSASIIFTGSSVGKTGRAYWGAYAVSKAASENLMQLLADECDEVNNIRVNSINPGAVRTAMRGKAYPAEDPANVTPAENIMNTYTFLMDDASKGVNGQQFDAQPKK